MNNNNATATSSSAFDQSLDLALGAGIVEVNGKEYMPDAKGALVPLALVKPVDKLMDQTVRGMISFARELSDQIARFRGHCFEDLGSFQALLAIQYKASVGGAKGNVTLISYDGCQKVQFQVADQITFGPELQAAKTLVDACLGEWSEKAPDEIKAIVNSAFNVDKEGNINRAELFMLLRVGISDPRWIMAMDAIRDSIRIIGSKIYIRFYQRPSAAAAWQAVTIDLASARG